MTAERAFLDTNVLVYLFDHDEPAKTQRAQQLLEQAKPGELALSAQVMGEFYVTVTRKLARPLDTARAVEALEWLSLLRVVALDAALVKTAIKTSRDAQISYWDALIVAAAGAAGCTRLLSEDLGDGQLIGAVRVENPFRADVA
jgi:predicted nucleic acid-binding protein